VLYYKVDMSRKWKIALDEYYHVYNRGVEKRDIFMNTADHQRFQTSLYVYNTSQRVTFRDIASNPYNFKKEDSLLSIGAYCLMPNHFHLLVRETVEGGISNFMQKLSTSYTMYFNTKYDRTGSLFQGSFKAEHLHTDPYLRHIFSYIHLNPLSIIEPEWDQSKSVSDSGKAQEFLQNYRHSSYIDYLDTDRLEKKILAKNLFPNYFQTKKDFEHLHSEWLKSTNEPIT